MALERLGQEQQWQFWRQGGQQLLFEPVNKGFLLRVRKANIKHILHVQEEQQFIAEFFGQLIGHGYLPKVLIVRVSSYFLQYLQHELLSAAVSQVTSIDTRLGPESVLLDTCTNSVTLIQDWRKVCPSNEFACLSNQFCLELKPKYASLPRTKLIPPSYKQKYLIYRCNRCCVKKDNQPTYIYCPSDIFSGDENKIYRALYSLVEQKRKYLQILSTSCPIEKNNQWEFILPLTTHILYRETPFLQRLYQIQLLDILDYKGVEMVWNRLLSMNPNRAMELEQTCYKKKFTSDWLEKERQDIETRHIPLIMNTKQEEQERRDWCWNGNIAKLQTCFDEAVAYLDTLEEKELQRLLEDFLLSTIAKDCSILIHVVEEYPNMVIDDCIWNRLTFMNSIYYYRIALIDLEPKSLNKLSQWLEEDHSFLLNE
eukprot:jgi/Galph1/1613/GphlegSOOS_G293.1